MLSKHSWLLYYDFRWWKTGLNYCTKSAHHGQDDGIFWTHSIIVLAFYGQKKGEKFCSAHRCEYRELKVSYLFEFSLGWVISLYNQITWRTLCGLNISGWLLGGDRFSLKAWMRNCASFCFARKTETTFCRNHKCIYKPNTAIEAACTKKLYWNAFYIETTS